MPTPAALQRGRKQLFSALCLGKANTFFSMDTTHSSSSPWRRPRFHTHCINFKHTTVEVHGAGRDSLAPTARA
jgi:hypothetical protein